jgi:hypothetical protein
MLSVLRAQGLNREAQSIGQLLAATFGAAAVALWNRIDGMLCNPLKIEPQTPVSEIAQEFRQSSPCSRGS